jgi:hypothetical protein
VGGDPDESDEDEEREDKACDPIGLHMGFILPGLRRSARPIS